VSAAILRHPPVRWGNVAGFVVFAVEPAVIFLMTLYLQEVLGLSPLATGLVFGVPGLAAVVAGIAAGRAIGRFGARPVLLVTTAVEGAAILPLLVVGPDPWRSRSSCRRCSSGSSGTWPAIVAVTVTATSGLPDAEQGLATGLTSMTQQVAISVGTPVLGAVAAAGSGLLAGIHLGLVVAVVAVLVGVLLVGRGLRDH
jgi:predicted MFS family arabinose efflux permease